ncbi:MAG TPA: hypothetical protein VMW77_02820 [Methanoregula sp.]|nr:hypothetical protein [Methanoregula sp.]
MRSVITALIITLAVILLFYWAPIVGIVFDESVALAQPLRVSDNSVNIGYVTGYAADFSKIGGTEISNPIPDSQKMGAVTFRMALNSYHTFFRSDMSIDLDKITVNFVSPSGSETLLQKSSRPMIKPGWTITKKTGVLPYEYADQDNILEPYESYEILVYPSTPLPPMSQFLIFIRLQDKNQIFITRSVPETITQVMSLN